MKKILTLGLAGAMVLSLLSGCAGKTAGEAVSVESVSMITGVGPVGVAEVYAGKVVSGETAEIKKDGDKTVLEVLVEEGDMVRQGDVLFTYDTEAMQLSLDKLYLDLESYENTVSAANSEIEELQKQQSKASSDQQLSYTLQIDARRADIREAEYNMAMKEKEIETMEASMDRTEITAPIAGRVMSVQSEDDEAGMNGDMYGGGTASDAFITIMDVSAYRVEGRINELNRGSLSEGMPVLVRSRTDDTVWTGFIGSIDWEKPVTNTNNNMYYGPAGDEMTTSSKYPFYVTLDSNDGLMLGQHVYIEPDYGQGNEAPAMLLPAWYIADGSYVWAANARDKLEKRPITLGEYDPDLDRYEILSGLDYTDYIAFPDEGLSEGMDVVRYDESSFGGDMGDFAFAEGFDAGFGDGDFGGDYQEEFYEEDFTEADYPSEEPPEEGVVYEEALPGPVDASDSDAMG